MNNTYQGFDNATYEEVQEYLKEFGRKNNLNDKQNDSPTVQEFLDLYAIFPFIRYIGYIIKKPREDYRVSIEGFKIDNLLAEQAEDLKINFSNADEFSDKKVFGEHIPVLHNVRFWWD